MKRNSLKVLSTLGMLGLAGVALVSCGKKDDTTTPTPTPEPTETPAYDPADLINGFDKSLSGTVKLTYNANYDMDVDSAAMASFKQKIRSTVTVEMDLGDELYFHATKVRGDLQVSDKKTTTEYLIYKNGADYYYETSATAPHKITTEDVRKQISDILSSATEEKTGSIDLSTLLYNQTDMTYFNSQLFCDLMGDDHDDYFENVPTYEKTSSNGLKATYKPEMVGYHTDSGYSSVSNKTDGYAATLTVETNDKGQVTSFRDLYNSPSVTMNLGPNTKPTITLTGERNFTASYGDSITKINSLEHEASTLKLTEAKGGSYVVMTAASYKDKMEAVNDGDSLKLGNYLFIKVTPDENLNSVNVSVNGVAGLPVNGWYMFEIVAGENTIAVECKEVPETLSSYSGTVNKVAVQLNIFADKTFEIICTEMDGKPTAVKGTYQSTGTQYILTASVINGFASVSNKSILTISADKSTASTDEFFTGDAVTFTLVTE